MLAKAGEGERGMGGLLTEFSPDCLFQSRQLNIGNSRTSSTIDRMNMPGFGTALQCRGTQSWWDPPDWRRYWHTVELGVSFISALHSCL